MKEIPLTKGQVAMVDDEDFAELSKTGWQAQWIPKARCFYAIRHVRTGKKRTRIYMHRQIMQARPGEKIDHRVPAETLNNQRGNLRNATTAENGYNRRVGINNTSGFKGVCRGRGRWTARIKAEGKRLFIGVFSAAEEAARAYDASARKLHGEFARLNFPEVA
jgi:hypothetical protein